MEKLRVGELSGLMSLLLVVFLAQASLARDDEFLPHSPPDEETPNSFDIKPITVEDALSTAEIDTIVRTKNHFLRDALDKDESLWNKLDRKYSKQFFKNRSDMYDLKDVLKAVLQNGIPMHYKIEELYRGGLAPQIALSGVLPSISLGFGDGATPISINNAFNGLFSFLLPQNWMNLVNANKAYDVSKLLFMQLALDEYFSAELQYIAVHKLIFDLEIYNFYLMHLELLTRTFPSHDKAILMVRGKMASVAGDMANTRIAVRLALDQLAFKMAMQKDRHDLFSASKVNIKNLDHFNETVQNLEDIDLKFAEKNRFIQEVIDRSIELRVVEELYRISRLNIGITAAGQLLSSGSNHDPKPQLVFNLGYQFIPKVLTARSNARTAKIDVDNQFLNMLNSARVSYDTYKYNFGLYVEARRSLLINRKAVKASLDAILDHGAPIDGIFLNSVIQLIDAHLKLNSSVHSAHSAVALMRRLMVTEEKDILSYIPVEKNINAALKLFLETYGNEFSDEEYLDNVMRTLHSKSRLERLLGGKWKDKEGKTRTFTPIAMQDAVLRNLNFLLHRRWNFPKLRSFFKVLRNYVKSNNLILNPHERNSLNLLADHIFVSSKKLKAPTE